VTVLYIGGVEKEGVKTAVLESQGDRLFDSERKKSETERGEAVFVRAREKSGSEPQQGVSSETEKSAKKG